MKRTITPIITIKDIAPIIVVIINIQKENYIIIIFFLYLDNKLIHKVNTCTLQIFRIINVNFYNKCALNSSGDFDERYAGGTSNTVHAPVFPSLDILLIALA